MGLYCSGNVYKSWLLDDFELDFYYLRSCVLYKQGVDLDDKLLIGSFSY
jgi:hypothetical protein